MTTDPRVFSRRLRTILSLDEERDLKWRAQAASRAMWQRVAQTMPDMSLPAVMERWAKDLAELPLSERARAGRDKLAVLEALGVANAATLVRAALARAELISERAFEAQLHTKRYRGVRRVG